ncbi:flavin reductase family protein [Eisenbergiella sp.]
MEKGLSSAGNGVLIEMESKNEKRIFICPVVNVPNRNLWLFLDGFYAILSSVNKKGHLYQTIKEKNEVVLNFPSVDIYERCMATIKHNGFEDDEIALSGLTAKPASKVDAPVIEECFMNLECKYLWEREITENSVHVLMCLEVVNVCVDEQHLDETKQGRYGESGLLYNVHYPINPEAFTGKSHDWIAVLTKYKDMGEY